jgi:hypothetical protein
MDRMRKSGASALGELIVGIHVLKNEPESQQANAVLSRYLLIILLYNIAIV